MKKKVAVFASGSGSNFQCLIDGIDQKTIQNAEIALLVANRRDIFALERAKKKNIASVIHRRKDYTDKTPYERDLLKVLSEHKIDYIVLAGYLAIVPKCVVDAYSQKIINVHPSLIPSFCGKGFYGMHVHNSVYQSGVKVTGATVHFVDAGVDTGKIIIQESVDINIEDSAVDIQKKVLDIEHRILPIALNALVNGNIIVANNRVFIKE